MENNNLFNFDELKKESSNNFIIKNVNFSKIVTFWNSMNYFQKEKILNFENEKISECFIRYLHNCFFLLKNVNFN